MTTPAAPASNGKHIQVSDIPEPAKTPISNGEADARLREQFNLITNIMASRADLFRRMTDPKRNIDDECGFPTGVISAREYQLKYERNPIAARAVEVMPRECFQVQPTVFEREDVEEVTEFEDRWDYVSNFLYSGPSWYQDEAGALIWDIFLQADIQSCVASYGIILIGVNDGLALSQPAELITVTRDKDGRYAGTSPTPLKELQFMRVFPEANATIAEWEQNKTSPRYGQPTFYNVTFADPSLSGGQVGQTNERVHWTRVVHIPSDGMGSSDVARDPILKTIYNNIHSLDKLYGGSAEMYWKGAFPGIFLNTIPQLGPDVQVDMKAIQDTMLNYTSGLQRWAVFTGLQPQPMAPQVVDPTQQINVQIEAICIRLAIPKRIFMGSERGELASSQDDAAWNDRVKQRQKMRVTPRIIIPTVNRLILLGVLPVPEGFSIEWPDITSQSAAERATLASTLTQAISSYVGGGCNAVIPEFDFLTRVIGWDEEEVQTILENAEEAKIKREEEDIAKQQELIAQGVIPDPTAPKIIQAPPGTEPPTDEEEEEEPVPAGKEEEE